MDPLRFRTVWISDVHLGLRDCQAGPLLEFLRSSRCDRLYLVGDIIDLGRLENDWHWPPAHTAVIRELWAKARAGTRIVYIPGNHDQALRALAGRSFGPLALALRAVHETADGRRLLVLHGDEFDALLRQNRLLSALGNGSYDLLQALERGINRLRHGLGYPRWPLCARVKTTRAVAGYITRFELAAARAARRHAVDGLVCGHIHQAALKRLEGVLYCNDGDWVESCAALVEHPDGDLRLLNWRQESKTGWRTA